MALIGSVSGSHTKLTDGTSYLIAGANVTITTGTNGAVTIGSTGGGSGVGTGFNDGGNTLNTTSSVAFAGLLGDSYYVANVGDDTFFFVSGSTGSKNTSQRGVAVFGGDLLASGNAIIVGATTITGALRQGAQVTATGQGSHAQGIGSRAEGSYSHAEGYFTTARASYSHAGGMGTITSGTGQTAVGKYNSRENNFSLFVVGDGTGTTDAERGDILRANPGNSIGSGRVEVTGTLASTIGVDSAFFVTSGANMTLKVDGEGGQTNRAIVLVNNTNPSPTFGSDVFLYVTGSAFSKDDALTRAVTVFAGDAVMSGALWGGYQTFGGLNTTQLNLKAGHYNIAGAGSSMDPNPTKQDILVYITGTASSKNGATRGVTVMAGDVVVSGTLYDGNGTAYIPGAGGGGGGGGDSAATYVVISATGSLSNERVLTAGTGISITDGGAGGNVTLSANVSGTFNDVSGKLSTTGTLAVAGNQGFNYFANNVGSNVSFYVSGSSGLQSAPASQGVSVFGGDVVLSGGLYGGYNSFIGNTYLSAQAAKIQIAGASTGNPPPVSATDTFLYISGTRGSKGTSNAGATVIGGDLIVSGTTYFGNGTLNQQVVIDAGGPALTSVDMFVIKAALYPYIQFVNNNTGGATTDGFKIGIESNYANISTREAQDMVLSTENTERIRIRNTGPVISVSGTLAVSGSMTLDRGTSLVMAGGTTSGAGNIRMGAVANMSYDTNLIYVDSNTKTMGISCGATPVFDTSNGPSLALRGNTYSAIGSQRGNIYLGAGYPTTPSNDEGAAFVLTNGTVRMKITNAGVTEVSGALRTTTDATVVGNLRTSKVELGGTSAFVSSSNGSSLEIGASTQVLILSGGAASSSNSRNFADTNFFVSGSTSSKGTSTRGTAVFGGDVVVSGTIFGGVNPTAPSPTTDLVLRGDQVKITKNALSFGQFGGQDVAVFVSGTVDGKNSGGVSLIGGDTVISGSLYLEKAVVPTVVSPVTNSVGSSPNSTGFITSSLALGNIFRVTLTNNTGSFLAPTSAKDGQQATWIVKQDSTGTRLGVWASGSNGFAWPGGVAPTLSTSASAVDMVTAQYDGSSSRWFATFAKGFV